jgi:hypothetical protein
MNESRFKMNGLNKGESMKKQYDHYLCDVNDLGDVLNQVNEAGEVITDSLYATDSSQVVIIVEKIEKDFSLLKKLVTKDEKEEQAEGE